MYRELLTCLWKISETCLQHAISCHPHQPLPHIRRARCLESLFTRQAVSMSWTPSKFPGVQGGRTAAGYILLQSEAADGDKSHSRHFGEPFSAGPFLPRRPGCRLLQSQAAQCGIELTLNASLQVDLLLAKIGHPWWMRASKTGHHLGPGHVRTADGGPRAIVSRCSEMAVQRETQVTFVF